MGQRRKSTCFVALILASSCKHSSVLARPSDELRVWPFLRPVLCCDCDCDCADVDALVGVGGACALVAVSSLSWVEEVRRGGSGGGGDGGADEPVPKEEKKSELRDGGCGGDDVSNPAGGIVTGLDGGVNQEMGELKMSFLLGFLGSSSDTRTGGEAAAAAAVWER